VFLVSGTGLAGLPEDAILVTRTASPDYARVIGRIKGIITDIGSVASHLASVAREFGAPALFDAPTASATLKAGEEITLVADTATVYQGVIPELVEASWTPRKKHVFGSPMHRRLRALLDHVSPLNLTDPESPDFTPAGCRTLHDIIRFGHEYAVKEMFGLGEAGAAEGQGAAVRLVSHIPLQLHLIDLGDGLRCGLTICDQVSADDLTSIPLKALWKGFSHPGISWTGAIGVNARSFMTLMMQGAAGGGGAVPGGASYAVLSQEYLNLSAKFGYHYASGPRPTPCPFSRG
jgi:pyruvate,water dikinase